MSKGTTTRAVRIDDALWAAATQTASDRGETVSDVIRRALRAYGVCDNYQPGETSHSLSCGCSAGRWLDNGPACRGCGHHAIDHPRR